MDRGQQLGISISLDENKILGVISSKLSSIDQNQELPFEERRLAGKIRTALDKTRWHALNLTGDFWVQPSGYPPMRRNVHSVGFNVIRNECGLPTIEDLKRLCLIGELEDLDKSGIASGGDLHQLLKEIKENPTIHKIIQSAQMYLENHKGAKSVAFGR